MIKFSKNKKTNGVLNEIYEDLMELGIEEIKYYYNTFKGTLDYNLVQYGEMIIYYDKIREFYKKHGYTTSIDKISDDRLWETYKNQVGYVVRCIIHGV